MTSSRYVFDNASEQAAPRFAGLEGTFDPTSRAHISALGLGDGWHCWEVGAGGGGLAAWLADRVAPGGTVLATDVDPSWMAHLSAANLSVERHDVTIDPMPTDRFDLIHARLVLSHLPSRDGVMRDLVAALRPGGWVVLEDFDSAFHDGLRPDPDDRDRAMFLKVHRALAAFVDQSGADTRYARDLPQRFASLGLEAVGADGRVVFARGGAPAAGVLRSGLLQVGEAMVARGMVGDAELARALALLDAPDFVFTLPLFISAWGRRPAWRRRQRAPAVSSR